MFPKSSGFLFRDCIASNEYTRAGTIESTERSLARGKVRTDKVQTLIDGHADVRLVGGEKRERQRERRREKKEDETAQMRESRKK